MIQKIAIVTLFIAVLTACAGYEPKDFTADDRCRDCAGGGLFSGPDGKFTIYETTKQPPAKAGGFK